MPHTSSFLPFRKAAVLGAGVMGAQIAAHLANAGLEVILLDIPAKEGPKNGIVEAAFQKILKMKPAPFADSAAPRRITTGNFEEHFHLLKDAEWVIEVVIEHLPVKQQLMARLEEALPAHTIVSTNTSGLPIHQIAEGRSPAFKSASWAPTSSILRATSNCWRSFPPRIPTPRCWKNSSGSAGCTWERVW